MANKYNIRAKRLSLDNMIRERAWSTFRSNFSRLIEDNNTGSADVGDSEGGGGTVKQQRGANKTKNLCNAVVQCRNHQTTHRTMLHSLCDISSDSSPPPSELIHLVARASSRSLLLHDSGNERTPLHLAINQGASLDTIKALLEVACQNNESIGKKDMLLALDSKQQTPLLAAVRKGIDDDTIKYLVNHDEDGSSLLFSGIRKSKKKKQQSQNEQYYYANLPLKYVASRESFFVGGGLDSPQDLLRFMIVQTYRAKMKRRFPQFYSNDGIIKDRNITNGERNNRIIDDTTIIGIDNDDDRTCLLQATILCHDLFGSSKVASSILSYIITHGLYHTEQLTSQQDMAGNLTLHIACLSDTPASYDHILRLGNYSFSDYGINDEDCTLIEYLIRATPHQCSTSSPYLTKNYEGDIPLHCAIKCGKDWNLIQMLVEACPTSVQCCTSKGELPLHLAIKCNRPIPYIIKLWNLYPESASILDVSTGLYPFQLAAIFGAKQQASRNSKSKKKPKSKEVTEEQVEDAWDETSLSFFMLRECPSILTSKYMLDSKVLNVE